MTGTRTDGTARGVRLRACFMGAKMIEYNEIIRQFESAYKHMGACAEHYNRHDIALWERAGMIDFITANIMRFINETIAANGGKFI